MTDISEGEISRLSKIAAKSKGNTELSFDDWKPSRPRTDKEIWRYRSLNHYVSILSEQCLWFSRPDQFDDPFEGILPIRNVIERKGENSCKASKNLSAISQIYPSIAYLNCWYSEEHESDAMWRLYTEEKDENKNGLAIKSTFLDLKKSLEYADEATFGEVEYRDYDIFEIKVIIR